MGTSGELRSRNVEVLLGLQVEIAVQLGENFMTPAELLRLGPGSIIELKKKAGDLLPVFIHGKKIGEGEVVRVGQHFGIHIKTLLSRIERVQQLKS